MKRKASRKFLFFTAVFLCFCMIINSGSVFAAVTPDFLDVDSIEIIERHGIVEGKSYSLSAEILPENALKSAVKWSSSNPSVISCTDDGIITGVSAGGYADITCEAKFGSEHDKIRVYCVESTGSPVKSGFTSFLTLIYAEPSMLKVVAWHFDIMSWFTEMIKLIAPALGPLMPPMTTTDANEFMIFSSKCIVNGRYNSYAYITFDNGTGERDGFVKYSRLSNPPNDFLKLSAENMDVWGNGYVNTNKKLTSNYKGESKIDWDVADESIVEFNEETGQVTGKKPGKTTITATVDGMTEKCTVHSLYRWPQTWTTKTNCNTSLYRADTSEYVVINSMPKGTSFEVYGDNGTSDGWAYGRATINGTYYWGYVPIDKVSVKGTISQYRNFNWLWPVSSKNGQTKANYISSPYGKRDTSSGMHKGMDITTGTPGEIAGYDVVSAFEGKVAYIGTDPNSKTGYCIAIRSEKVDPISGKKVVAIYMHLNQKPIVQFGQSISEGQKIGYVGNTGSTSTGYHLHFEANNQNVSIGDGGDTRDYYANLINPLFFFTTYRNNYIIGTKADKEGNDDKIIINSGSDAVSKYYGAYWYGDDTKEK
ncbi:MAG: Ig-like domain-containing protein [Clostridia bacterium]|nr:Ig-like domain-containing protein [Clostridia bacterium]